MFRIYIFRVYCSLKPPCRLIDLPVRKDELSATELRHKTMADRLVEFSLGPVRNLALSKLFIKYTLPGLEVNFLVHLQSFASKIFSTSKLVRPLANSFSLKCQWPCLISDAMKTIAPKPWRTTKHANANVWHRASVQYRWPVANEKTCSSELSDRCVICLTCRPHIPSCVRTAFYECLGHMDDSNSLKFAKGYSSHSQITKITRILRVCEG